MMNTQKLLLEFLRPDQSGEIYGADNFPPPYRDQISSPYSRAGNFLENIIMVVTIRWWWWRLSLWWWLWWSWWWRWWWCKRLQYWQIMIILEKKEVSSYQFWHSTSCINLRSLILLFSTQCTSSNKASTDESSSTHHFFFSLKPSLRFFSSR